ncbi:MAG: stage VI sporulation protein F [Bacilli bacterium]
MAVDDSVFEKVEKKTKVSKSKIIELATKLQQNSLKDENTLRDVIHELSKMTGKSVSKAKEDKIIDTIVRDKVPKNVEKMF